MNARHGSSLIEMVMSIGVLAVALPLGLGAIRQAGDGLRLAREDGLSVALVRETLAELNLARKGQSDILESIHWSGDFPASGKVVGVIFDASGRMARGLTINEYQNGVPATSMPRMTHFAVAEGRWDASRGLMQLAIRIEFPASAKQRSRQAITYHTLAR